jgi:hypothetical protein
VDWIKNFLSTRNVPHWQTQSERIEEDIPSKWNSKASKNSYTPYLKDQTKSKLASRDKEGHFILMKGIIHQKDVMLRKSNTDGVNLIKVHYMHVCKYHNETHLYN